MRVGFASSCSLLRFGYFFIIMIGVYLPFSFHVEFDRLCLELFLLEKEFVIVYFFFPEDLIQVHSPIPFLPLHILCVFLV